MKILIIINRIPVIMPTNEQCMPILLYGLESCQLSNADLRSLDLKLLLLIAYL